MTDFNLRLAEVQSRIISTCKRCGRDPADVTLLAVSKTFPFSHVEEAYAAGQLHFGENYIQDCLEKMDQARSVKIHLKWHFIGHLQSNKVKFFNPDFHLFHGLDSLKLAQRLARRALSGGFVARALVQVNIGNEASKAGISVASLFDFLTNVRYIEGLSIEGLMAIPPAVASPEASRPYFRSLRQLFIRAKSEIFPDSSVFQQISMGMSKDYEVAIEEGATIVRVGSLLFGQRKKGSI
ncbi:YggS family pyridoxal phosphate-dependent enzyme [bacterium]|nr:YggS family pyridoxal phosphate-dependent enzyme [bacterium]